MCIRDRAHYKVSCRRRNFAEKTSTFLAKRFDSIYIEDLNVRGMLKNHRLARAISDEAWSMTIAALERKAEVFGLQVHRIDRFAPSSKTCFICKAYKSDLTLKDRNFNCGSCKRTSDRDLNAAKNIFEIGRLTLGGAAADVTSVEISPLPIIPTRKIGKCESRKQKSTQTQISA